VKGNEKSSGLTERLDLLSIRFGTTFYIPQNKYTERGGGRKRTKRGRIWKRNVF